MLIFRGLPGSPDPYVKIIEFNPKSAELLQCVDNWSRLYGKPVNVNAIDNGIHGMNDTKFTFHGKSLAWDVSPTTFTKEDYVGLGKYLMMNLPSPFQVVIESDHVHIEWDTGQGK